MCPMYRVCASCLHIETCELEFENECEGWHCDCEWICTCPEPYCEMNEDCLTEEEKERVENV